MLIKVSLGGEESLQNCTYILPIFLRRQAMCMLVIPIICVTDNGALAVSKMQ